MKKLWIALLLMLSLATPALGESVKPVEPIRIGVFEPLTGSKAAGGIMEYEGIQAAHALRPQVLGRPIELVVMDNKSEDDAAVRAAELLVEADVDIVLGSWGSSLSIAGGPVFEAAQVPAIGTSCTNPDVTLGNAYYFRVCYVDDFQGALLAGYARDDLGATSAAILCDIANVYAIGLRQYFRETFGPENITAEAYFSPGDTDFANQIENIMQTDPDVIFIPSDYTEPALIIRQAHRMGYTDVLFLGGDTWETDAFINAGGKDLSACRFTTFYDINADPTPTSEAFLAEYTALFGSRPRGAVTALGHDAYMAAVLAIEAAGSTDSAAVLEALQALSFEGVTGPISFDENGNAIVTQAVIKTVKNGEFVYVDTIHVPSDQ